LSLPGKQPQKVGIEELDGRRNFD